MNAFKLIQICSFEPKLQERKINDNGTTELQINHIWGFEFEVNF